MKKIQFIIAVILTSVSLFAQTPIQFKSKNGTKTQWKTVGDSTESYYAPLPVELIRNSSATDAGVYIGSRDTWGAAKDTSTYDFSNNYMVGYISVTNTSATADTLVFEHFSISKGDWTTHAIGFRDILTDYLEADNSTVIIAGSTNKTFEINMYRPGRVRVRPKTLTGRVSIKTQYVYFKGVN